MHIFAPPLLDHYFSPNEIKYNDGVRAADEKFSAIFCAILFIFSQLGKKFALFFQLGKKYAFSPLFSFPFNHFFPPTCYLATFLPSRGGVGQTEKYTPLEQRRKKTSEKKKKIIKFFLNLSACWQSDRWKPSAASWSSCTRTLAGSWSSSCV